MKILREGYNYNNNIVDDALKNLNTSIDNKMRYYLFDVKDGATRDNSVLVNWVTTEDYDEGMLDNFTSTFESEILPLIKENSTNINRVILEVSYKGYSDDVDKFEYEVEEEEVKEDEIKEESLKEDATTGDRFRVRYFKDKDDHKAMDGYVFSDSFSGAEAQIMEFNPNALVVRIEKVQEGAGLKESFNKGLKEDVSSEIRSAVSKYFNGVIIPWETLDVIEDLVDRALDDDGVSADEAVSDAIDTGLIYSSDIWKIRQFYEDATLSDETFEALYNDVYAIVSDLREDDDFDESREAPEKKPLKESLSDEDRAEALAQYLNVDASTIKSTGYNSFETEDGEEYFVVDEDEAYDLAKQDLESIVDDIGIEAFTPEFRDWIYDNALDVEWFEDALREDYEYYLDDIESESSDKFENRLIEELYDDGILVDDDFEEDEDGNVDYTILSDDVDIEASKGEWVDNRMYQIGDYYEEFKDQFGKDAAQQAIERNNLVDIDKVVEEAIEEDGVAHFISYYDGKEIELDDDLFAYRTN